MTLSKTTLFLLSIVLFFACTNQETKKAEKPKQYKKVKKLAHKKTKSKKKNYVKLNNENAVQYLTKYGKENPETKILIKTNLGDIKIKLYKETPLHRANFIRLVKNNYYDDALFYRVVKGFIVQTGNSDEKTHSERRSELGKYEIPAEFKPHLIHKKGALSMSRSYNDNPEKKSACYDFFIVHGTVLYGPELKVTEPEFRRKIYGTIGGADHLDNEHTVFGEVTSGLSVIDKIADAETDRGEWPKKDIKITKVSIIE